MLEVKPSAETDRYEVMTAAEVASHLRCSKAHIYKAIRGKLPGVSQLPAIALGRRRLVRRVALEQWKRENEAGTAMIDPSLKNRAVDA